MMNKALNDEMGQAGLAEPTAADHAPELEPSAPPVDVDGVIAAGVEAGWSLRRISDHLASVGSPLSHETVRSRVAKLGSDVERPSKQSLAQAKLDEDYIEAAAMAAVRPSCSASPMVKPVSFMRNNPDMLLGWRSAGLGSKSIASILTAMGMPVAGQTVLNVLRSLVDGSDPSRIKRIANRINLLIASGVAPLSAPVSSASHASAPFASASPAAQFPTLEARPAHVSNASAGHPLSKEPAPSPAPSSAPLPHGHASARSTGAGRAGVAPTSVQLVKGNPALQAKRPAAAPVEAAPSRLLDLVGEAEDFDSSLWDEPVSYREVREALWEQARLGTKHAYSIAPGGREVMDISSRAAAKAISGALAGWKEFLHELNK